MKRIIEVTEEKEIEIGFLKINASPRYWEDAEINGAEDTDGDMVPFRVEDTWQPVIDIETGVILEWPSGTTARIHYKVCDAGSYFLLDEGKNIIGSIEEDYVPSIACPEGLGYGDYIIMNVDELGKVENWPKNPDLSKFFCKA
jgi:hypothetical protein